MEATAERPRRPLILVTAALLVFGAVAVWFQSSGREASAPGSDIGEAFRIDFSGPEPKIWQTASRGDNQCWTVKADERGFHTKLNAERKQRGKVTLKLDPELSKAARKHTSEMTGQNLLHHTSESALRRRVTFWSTLGENVGVGGTVDSLHTAFMNSPAHRDNVLYSGFRNVGVGTKVDGGRLWVTFIFEAKDNPGTTLPMPRC